MSRGDRVEIAGVVGRPKNPISTISAHTHTMAALSKNIALNGIKTMHAEIVEGNIDDYSDTMVKLQMERLNKMHKIFEDKHNQILQEFEDNIPKGKEASDEEMLKIDAMTGLYWKVEELVLHTKAVLMDKEKKSAQGVKKEGEAPGVQDIGHGMKLPPIQMKIFDGKDENWLEFRDMFESMIHLRKDCTPAYKLARLKEFVDQTKVTQVAGVYTGGYDQVWKEVKERYDRPKRLAAAHVDVLLNLEDNPILSRLGVRAVIDKFRGYRRAMTVMELPTDKWDGLLFPILFRKLPNEAVAYYNRTVRGNAIPAVTEILEVLEEYAETLAVDDESNTMEEPFRNRRPQRSNLARATGGHTVCPICNGAHAMTKCSQFMAMTVDQRWEVAYKNRVCYNCLGSGHINRNCSAGGCTVCRGNHHSLLHGPAVQQGQQAPAAGTTPQVLSRT